MPYCLMRFTFLLPIILLFSLKVKSQSALFNHLTIDNGLSDNSIGCLEQDPKGFIWIGTYNGFNKFDGYKITPFIADENDSSKFMGRIVRCMYADNDNNLWIGSQEAGFSKLDLLTNKFTHFSYDSIDANTIPSNCVNDIKEFEPGILYIGTSKGLCIFDKKTNKITRVLHSDKNPNSLLTNKITTMTKDKNGNIWFGHYGSGITKFIPKENKYIRYTASNPKTKLNGTQVRYLFADSKGIIWISLWSGGITIYDTNKDYFWDRTDTIGIYRNTNKIGLVSKIIEDKNSDIWMCGAEKGVIKFERKTGKVISFEHNPDDPESVSDNTNLTIMVDKGGLIWSGTWKEGVNYFNPNCLQFGHIKHESNKPNTLKDNGILSFFEESESQIIVGTNRSLCYFNPKTYSFINPIYKDLDKDWLIERSQVSFILQDFDSTYWYATNGGGLYHHDPIQKKSKNYNVTNLPNSFANQIPYGMVLDNDNNLWIGTWGDGLRLYNREKDNFSYYLNDPKNKELYCDVILTLKKDNEGNIWIGTRSCGLVRLDPKTKTFTRLFSENKKSNLYSGGVTIISFDANNNMWFTSDDHLIEMNIKTLKYIDHSENNKLLRASFYGLQFDKSNNIWLTSTSGLFRYNPVTKSIRLFQRHDGLQSKEFNHKSFIKLSNGYFLAGGINGFNYFNPNTIKDDSIVPSIAFTDFLVLNKPNFLKQDISRTNQVTLSYKDYFFSIHFAALDYSDPQKNVFKYKMDGLDNDWISINNQHQLTFTNLDPGDYTLNIKAANSNGVWNEEALQLKITITPPFWRTNWFYALCIISVAASIYFYIKYREKKLMQEKAILEKKVEERTEELNEEKLKVEEAHKDIKDSIYYAQKIQSAIIPTEEDFNRVFPSSFVLFQPKDIVSGDFYWLVEKEQHVFCAIGDCTGHGVPGGFMTMLGSGLLNEIVNEQQIFEPSEIINKLREKIISTLKQTGKSGENKDGMDIVLLRFNKKSRELKYATANNGFLLLANGGLTEHYGDKQPVGIYGDEIKPFTSHTLILEENTILYSYTDGYPDQFGGEKGKKFKYKALNNLLLNNSQLEMKDQKAKLEEAFFAWKGTLEQIDDVCVIGIKL